MKLLLEYLKNYKSLIFLALLLAAVNQVFSLLDPWIFRKIIDTYVTRYQEYTTEELSEYVNKEPVIFESKWLQNLSDVKALAEWIKTKAVNRGRLVNMSVFGNPLISVGDIVTIKYTYQGFAGTEKLIITNVTHRYNEGLETSISCRTLG
jgi:ABC-type multidrug transport system fused ATPase/permease subunit